MKEPKHNKSNTGSAAQDRAANLVDQLAEFEDFKLTVLPALRADLKNGMTAPEIMKKYAALAAARTVSIAGTEIDSSKALAAAKDIIDRAEGKPKERVEHTHKYDELTDEELDAQVLSRADEMAQRQADRMAHGTQASQSLAATENGKKLLN